MAVHHPPEPQADHRLQGGDTPVGPVHRLVQYGGQLLALLVHERHGLALEARRPQVPRRVGDPAGVRRPAFLGRLALARRPQPLGAEVPRGPRHPVARRPWSTGVADRFEDVDGRQPGQQGRHLPGRHATAAAQEGRGGLVERPGKHAGPAPDDPRGTLAQCVARPDGGPQRTVPAQRGALAVQPALVHLQDGGEVVHLLERELLGGQFEGERDPFERAADPLHRPLIGALGTETVHRGPGPAQEEFHPGTCGERRQPQHLFLAQPQRLSRGHQHPQSGHGRQQPLHQPHGRPLDRVHVIEEEQDARRGQLPHQVGEVTLRALAGERPAHGPRQCPRGARTLTLPVHMDDLPPWPPCSHGRRQPALADARPPGHGHQPVLRQQPLQPGRLLCSPHQVIGGSGAAHPWRRRAADALPHVHDFPHSPDTRVR